MNQNIYTTIRSNAPDKRKANKNCHNFNQPFDENCLDFDSVQSEGVYMKPTAQIYLICL